MFFKPKYIILCILCNWMMGLWKFGVTCIPIFVIFPAYHQQSHLNVYLHLWFSLLITSSLTFMYTYICDLSCLSPAVSPLCIPTFVIFPAYHQQSHLNVYLHLLPWYYYFDIRLYYCDIRSPWLHQNNIIYFKQ